MNSKVDFYICERSPDFTKVFSINEDDSSDLIKLDALSGNGTNTIQSEYVESSFAGKENVYQLSFILPGRFVCNGVGVRFRLRSWKDIQYVAIGYTLSGTFRHVKISNIAFDRWLTFSVGHNDLVFGIQNDWEYPSATEIYDIRVYIKGTPGDSNAFLDVESMWCWRESESGLPKWLELTPRSRELESARWLPLKKAIYDYYLKCFNSYEEQAIAFHNEGKCPLYGGELLEWTHGDLQPSDLGKVNTYRFSWHALHPAAILMTYAHMSDDMSSLFSARDFITNWMDSSYYRVDEDKKFAWYDHGVAERLLTMILMYEQGLRNNFDNRFISRLRFAIYRHAQLLESEAFYAFHQPTRYHNHAWFQDLALLVSGIAFPEIPSSSRWISRSLERLTEQFDTLIVRDNSYAIFVENSIGYHQGIQRIVGFAGELVGLSGFDTHISEISEELSLWSKFLRYPDGRTPCQGDTFRFPPYSGELVRRGVTYEHPSCTVLSEAGYAVIKGNHENKPFMLCLFASSLNTTHKHEDNLSFTLWFDGVEWLIDPSFYSHEYSDDIPRFLRSAAAHNTVYLPGVEYSIEPGKAKINGAVMDGEFTIASEHTCYSDVKVERNIHGYLDCFNVDIIDSVGSYTGDACTLLHFAENTQVSNIDGSIVEITHPDSNYCLIFESDNTSDTKNKQFYRHLKNIAGRGFMDSVSTEQLAIGLSDAKLTWNLRFVPKGNK